MGFEIVHKFGHYELYLDGKFLSSCDTYGEALDEIKAFEKFAEK